MADTENTRAPAGGSEPAMLPVELRGVAEELQAGDGFWRACSGCHESNEGHATGPYSAVFQCHLGMGCRECGGLGAVWDDTDYEAMADFMAAQDSGALASAPASAPLPLTDEHRLQLHMAAEALDDAAEAHDHLGNNSTADGARARAHELRQIAAAGHQAAPSGVSSGVSDTSAGGKAE